MSNKIKVINYTKDIVRATALSIIVTLLALLLQTIIMLYTDVSESILPVTSAITMTLSIAISSIYFSLRVRKKGWLNGGIIGVLYILIIVILSLVFLEDFVLNTYVILKSIIALVTGTISGMIGVNLK